MATNFQNRHFQRFQNKQIVQTSISEYKNNAGERLIFKCAGSFELNTPLYINCFNFIGNERNDLFTTKMSLKNHDSKRRSVYYFEPFQLYSNQFNGPLEDQEVYFEVISVTDMIGGHCKETIIGCSSTLLKPIIQLDRSSLLQMKILDDEDERTIGKLNFGHPKLRPVLSFLDYKINLNIDFIPIIAIDFSLSNVIDDLKKKEFINDYIPVINHIRHIYKDISPY